jgi:alkanesulfonate monooxygenase
MDLRIFTEPQFGATYEQQLAMALVAEEVGFDAWVRSDHYLTMGGDGLPGPTDSWVTLGALARETSRIRLGTLVTSATFRQPGPLAIAVAQVDQMSGGRVDFGLGTGWFEDEHRAYGIPFSTFGERFDRLEEQLEIIRGMWTTPAGETFSYDGAHYQVADSPGLPKPAQQPHPPIILGGAGPRRTPVLAARFADEFNTPFHRLDDATAQFDRVRAACEDAGRDPGSILYSGALATVVGADEDEYRRRCEATGQNPEDLRANQAGGTPAEIVERLRAFGEAGASRMYLQLLDFDDLDHVRLIGTEVLPHLQE